VRNSIKKKALYSVTEMFKEVAAEVELRNTQTERDLEEDDVYG
jgi:hypothetical protein